MSAIKLTASQEREILRAENWPQDCSLTREGKLDIGREAIAFERKALREGYQAKTVESLAKRIRAVEKELAGAYELIGKTIAKWVDKELKRRCVMQFKGVWDAETEYRRGDCVNHAGSFRCCIDTVKRSVPGKSADFKLIAKAGSTS